ncbi:protein asteroid homolog 1 isoform X2 [Lagenorhynchus albirostris]|uniref:single-strand DNA endonuclease ASTE1 isoform X3 n=1 Tax=Sagmatias obliquidens TaxID=3371155 RepID=UPI000F440B40|nr:protein asteroid homolog 1 isoform X3 [Lagenorhynchus obliquidens]XP_030732280.1 protein asteroid homolog 1 isoform X3 [Globicephala melas]XP_060005847.1 protein asteroid homolog 1 isoform X2 [Lagenorhynchus albirostris]XP_060154602.1 protein asteroid homolog 1 isoform X4 [Globicephala melas]
MGIRGLMSFVEDHINEFFTDLKLRDTKIIIDGYALFHRLCFSSNLELRYGGDYDSFTDVVEKFFESLFACKICPYVVLDGGCDISDKKLNTLKDRAREKIQMAHSLSVGGGGYVCPLLIREVFIQVLIKLRVRFVQCFSEADRDIMTLANHWNCPVLSSDSDFCIFDLKSGFCPLNSFQWRNMNTIKGTRDCYIPAKCFSLDALCCHFGNMNKVLLPLFAVLCGNDHVNLPVVETFLSKVENMQRPNAHRISLPIRQVIYGLLVNTPPHPGNVAWDALPPQPPAFSEVERINKNIKTSIVGAVELPKDHSDLSKLTELSLARRQILLLETLKVKQSILDPIPAALKLPIAVSCYWVQHTEAKAKLHHLQALLLGMLMGPLHAMINSPDEEAPQGGGAEMLYEELQRVKAQPGLRLDLDTAHVFCQWQCCLQMGLYLNQLLSTPLPEPDLTRLYSGSLVHGLCQQLLTSASVESLLHVCPEAQQLYEHMFSATRSCAPAELVLPKGKSKKRRQKKRRTPWSENRVGTTLNARSWHEGGNRFELLMVGTLEEHMEAAELE